MVIVEYLVILQVILQVQILIVQIKCIGKKIFQDWR